MSRAARAHVDRIGRRKALQSAVSLAAALVALGVCAREATAQEIHITGPLHGACILILKRFATPAIAEWAYWVSTGASFTHVPARRSWSPTAGVGAELTFEVARYRGFPESTLFPSGSLTPDLERYGRFAGVRLGPWVEAATRDAGALVEGGAVLQVDGTSARRSLGGFGLRLGAGYGAFDNARVPHAAATLTYGFHSVPARHTSGGVCDPPIAPRRLAEAAFGRVFVTHRRALGAGETWEIALGVEITPTWLFRPLRWLIGRWKE
jgi:hypothetical protein